MNRTPQPVVGKNALTFWEYAGEFILAGLFCVLLLIWFGSDRLHGNLCKLRTDLLTGIGLALGLSVAIWIGLLTIFSSNFGVWLRKKGEATAYSLAFATPVLAYTLIFLLVLVTICSAHHYLIILNISALSYGLLNI